MSILPIILTILVVGLILWAINQYVPLEARVKQILNIVVIIFLVIWLLKILGVWSFLATVKV